MPDRRTCPDGGTCHHECAEFQTCFRVKTSEPLSGVFPDDEWPVGIRLHPDLRAPDFPDEVRIADDGTIIEFTRNHTSRPIDPSEPPLLIGRIELGVAGDADGDFFLAITFHVECESCGGNHPSPMYVMPLDQASASLVDMVDQAIKFGIEARDSGEWNHEA